MPEERNQYIITGINPDLVRRYFEGYDSVSKSKGVTQYVSSEYPVMVDDFERTVFTQEEDIVLDILKAHLEGDFEEISVIKG